MKETRTRQAGTWIVMATILWVSQWGCSTMPPPGNGPYFPFPAAEAKALQTLIKKQEALIAKCGSKSSCDHAYFVRGLAALYENREAAIRYFEKVIEVAPRSSLAASSKTWIEVLQSGTVAAERLWVQQVVEGPAASRSNVMLNQVAERAVHDLLDREFTIQQLRLIQEADSQSVEGLHRELQEQEKKVEALTSKREATRISVEAGTLQSLQRQLVDRDKKIQELTSQLEALKRIDQEMRDKIRPIRPPSNAAAPATLDPTKP